MLVYSPKIVKKKIKEIILNFRIYIEYSCISLQWIAKSWKSEHFYRGRKNLSFLLVIELRCRAIGQAELKGERGHASFVPSWNARGASRMLQFSGVLLATLDYVPFTWTLGREYAGSSPSLLQRGFSKSFVLDKGEKNRFHLTIDGHWHARREQWNDFDFWKKERWDTSLFSLAPPESRIARRIAVNSDDEYMRW